MNNILLTLLLLTVFCVDSFSQTSELWKDPEVNEENRMPAHNDFVNKGEQRLSLHGLWNFDFDGPVCADGKIVTKASPLQMPIPGMWELNGCGEPMYAGQDYEWKGWWTSNPPLLPDSANYRGVYTCSYLIPADWKG